MSTVFYHLGQSINSYSSIACQYCNHNHPEAEVFGQRWRISTNLSSRTLRNPVPHSRISIRERTPYLLPPSVLLANPSPHHKPVGIIVTAPRSPSAKRIVPNPALILSSPVLCIVAGLCCPRRTPCWTRRNPAHALPGEP